MTCLFQSRFILIWKCIFTKSCIFLSRWVCRKTRGAVWSCTPLYKCTSKSSPVLSKLVRHLLPIRSFLNILHQSDRISFFSWKRAATTSVLPLKCNLNLLELQRLVPGQLLLYFHLSCQIFSPNKEPLIIPNFHSGPIWGTHKAIYMQTRMLLISRIGNCIQTSWIYQAVLRGGTDQTWCQRQAMTGTRTLNIVSSRLR